MLTNSRDIRRRLEAEGWTLARVRGSHHTFKHRDKKLPITFQHPVKDLGVGLVRKIYRLAGWDKD
ncbi:MAG: type II toxin-antitoxin system HicA family toxin [Methylobacteriaceae bacterium]|nr:type II toxin-antitoxin system HicA family toxin [Methylobacteriaceae bacterium]MBV9245187.1 type II toxin-antitoxin system HicA family toxin [Methylobacteriaceae bacterium]